MFCILFLSIEIMFSHLRYIKANYNNSFDICYESSFIKMKEIFSGTYQIKDSEILFYYKSSIPNGCSKKAQFEENDRVIRFYDVDGNHLLPFYTY